MNGLKSIRAVLLGSGIVLTAVLGIGFATTAVSAEDATVIPAPAVDAEPGSGLQTAIFAGGCFWGVQGVFQHVDGVVNAVSGYAGGDSGTAMYEAVGTGQTGHAEAVEITFDPGVVSYGDLLQIYFSVAHDPTQLNRQGPDVGTQYRSTIFPLGDAQAQVAQAYIDQLNAAQVFHAAIATTIERGHDFFVAEDYHQDFLADNPTYPYIVINDLPKVENLKALFPDEYRDDPVLVAEATN